MNSAIKTYFVRDGIDYYEEENKKYFLVAYEDWGKPLNEYIDCHPTIEKRKFFTSMIRDVLRGIRDLKLNAITAMRISNHQILVKAEYNSTTEETEYRFKISNTEGLLLGTYANSAKVEATFNTKWAISGLENIVLNYTKRSEDGFDYRKFIKDEQKVVFGNLSADLLSENREELICKYRIAEHPDYLFYINDRNIKVAENGIEGALSTCEMNRLSHEGCEKGIVSAGEMRYKITSDNNSSHSLFNTISNMILFRKGEKTELKEVSSIHENCEPIKESPGIIDISFNVCEKLTSSNDESSTVLLIVWIAGIVGIVGIVIILAYIIYFIYQRCSRKRANPRNSEQRMNDGETGNLISQ